MVGCKYSDIQIMLSAFNISGNELDVILAYGHEPDYSGEEWKNEYSNPIDLVQSLTVSGGPLDPFEKVTLKVSKKNLSTIYPQFSVYSNELVTTGTSTYSDNLYMPIAGKSRIRFKLYSDRELSYVVTAAKLNGGTYTFTAYCEAEKYRGTAMNPGDNYESAWGAIESILVNGAYQFDLSDVITNIISNEDDPGYNDFKCENLRFTEKTTQWAALQICAYILKARIFFSGGKVYVINYTTLNKCAKDSMDIPLLEASNRAYTAHDDSWVSINPTPDELSLDLTTTEPDHTFCGRVSGSVELGNEGYNTVVNVVSTKIEGDDTDRDYEFKDSSSIGIVGPVVENYNLSWYIPVDLLKNTQLRKKFAEGILAYKAEPMESIGFTLVEKDVSAGELQWTPIIPTVAYANQITDYEDDAAVSSVSLISKEIKPEKLSLSSYTRKYPNYITEYWFGIADNIDLASSTSHILSRLG